MASLPSFSKENTSTAVSSVQLALSGRMGSTAGERENGMSTALPISSANSVNGVNLRGGEELSYDDSKRALSSTTSGNRNGNTLNVTQSGVMNSYALSPTDLGSSVTPTVALPRVALPSSDPATDAVIAIPPNSFVSPTLSELDDGMSMSMDMNMGMSMNMGMDLGLGQSLSNVGTEIRTEIGTEIVVDTGAVTTTASATNASTTPGNGGGRVSSPIDRREQVPGTVHCLNNVE